MTAEQPGRFDSTEALFRQYAETHAPHLRREIIERQHELVRSVASKFVRSGVSVEDLVQCGWLALIRAVDRPTFAAHVDPVNLVMTPRTYFNTGALIRECFEKLGPWIVSCHAKDITLHHEAALHLDEVQIGEGNLDYQTYLGLLDQMPREVPLMLEHLEAPQYAVARDRIFAVGDEIGVAFAVRP